MKIKICLYHYCQKEYFLPQNLLLSTDTDRAETAESAGIKCQQ